MLKIFEESSAKTRSRKPLFLLGFLLQWELLVAGLVRPETAMIVTLSIDRDSPKRTRPAFQTLPKSDRVRRRPGLQIGRDYFVFRNYSGAGIS